MDFTLRCNSLNCRAALTERALVTTCSHIFCLDCAQALGLTSNGVRICPACQSELLNQDDAAITCLNPSEDYKTSVLSGMTPSTIMECAGRALAFYSYQTTQEIIYQEYMAKSLTEKYGTLSAQLDKIIHDANAEILNLRERIENLQAEQNDLEQKNHELGESYKDKARSQQQITKLYQSLKAQVMASHVQTAASDDAEIALQRMTGHHSADRMDTRSGSETQIPGFMMNTPATRLSSQRRKTGVSRGLGADLGRNQRGTTARGYMSHSTSIGATPALRRTRLPVPTPNRNQDINMGGLSQTPNISRQPLGSLSQTTLSRDNIRGFGLGAGTRMGKQVEPPFSRGGGIGQMGPPGFTTR